MENIWRRNMEDIFVVTFGIKKRDSMCNLQYTTSDLLGFVNFLDGHGEFYKWKYLNVHFRHGYNYFDDKQIANYTPKQRPTAETPTVEEVKRYLSIARQKLEPDYIKAIETTVRAYSEYLESIKEEKPETW